MWESRENSQLQKSVEIFSVFIFQKQKALVVLITKTSNKNYIKYRKLLPQYLRFNRRLWPDLNSPLEDILVCLRLQYHAVFKSQTMCLIIPAMTRAKWCTVSCLLNGYFSPLNRCYFYVLTWTLPPATADFWEPGAASFPRRSLESKMSAFCRETITTQQKPTYTTVIRPTY